jgi:hypothetical protein
MAYPLNVGTRTRHFAHTCPPTLLLFADVRTRRVRVHASRVRVHASRVRVHASRVRAHASRVGVLLQTPRKLFNNLREWRPVRGVPRVAPLHDGDKVTVMVESLVRDCWSPTRLEQAEVARESRAVMKCESVLL